jgi:hypothetical protein
LLGQLDSLALQALAAARRTRTRVRAPAEKAQAYFTGFDFSFGHCFLVLEYFCVRELLLIIGDKCAAVKCKTVTFKELTRHIYLWHYLM